MKKYPVFILFGIVFFAVLIATSILLNKRDVSLGYDFSEPNETIILPDILREVSGIAIEDNHQLVCVQDENGALFQFDTKSLEIVTQSYFGEDGDYEGVCKAGSFFYVLRSDGVLFEFDNQFMKKVEVIMEEDAPDIDNTPAKQYDTGIPIDENEGLCFDQKNNRLLIISREQSPHTKNKERVVYAFDLAKKRLSKKRAFTLNPFSGKWKKPSDLSFRPSELALHPLTGELYVLSSKDHALFVFSPAGKIKTIQRLNPTIFAKPEGIAFMENGDVYISNEGKHDRPTLLFFRYTAKKL
ncbi:MAG: SdiA-regulated domain-containing protein [Fluviicola sp.]|nr:SdiA-regulated domain-containing protein [Fluviicola sp.]